MMENNKTLPKISIITPTLNQAEFIEKTILSVLNQNYPDLEYLVFDGGSNDGTQEILKKYSKDIKWRSEPDQGQSSAINKGLRICSGEIIGFINSDDQYEPSALLKVGNFFASHPEAMWVTGKCKIINEYEKEVFSFVSFYKHILLRFHHPSLLGVVNYIPQPQPSGVEKYWKLWVSLMRVFAMSWITTTGLDFHNAIVYTSSTSIYLNFESILPQKHGQVQLHNRMKRKIWSDVM